MSVRSDFILGTYVFIKIIRLDEERGIRLVNALTNSNLLPPFTSNEFLINYLISQDKSPIYNNNNDHNNEYSLLSPGTLVLVSGQDHTLNDFEKYKYTSYNDTITQLRKNFSPFGDYLEQSISLSNEGKYIRTALIISRKVTGNYDDFIKKYTYDKDFNKLFEDSLIHISYLYHYLQNKFQCVHGDPKTQNYTWLELDEPIDIVYDFRDKYDKSDNKIIRRRNIKHLFYLTDLEFVYSPILKSIHSGKEDYYFNFKHNVEWYNDTDKKVYVPKISADPLYDHNFNLYGGYDVSITDKMNDGIFPRMFTIDLLVLIKMFLTYYVEFFNGSNLRKLNMYFSSFVSLSEMEQNSHRRNTGNYITLSPSSLAQLMNSS